MKLLRYQQAPAATKAICNRCSASAMFFNRSKILLLCPEAGPQP